MSKGKKKAEEINKTINAETIGNPSAQLQCLRFPIYVDGI